LNFDYDEVFLLGLFFRIIDVLDLLFILADGTFNDS